MASKLEGNGLFESSRMILPEHKEAYIQYMTHKDEHSKPIIDEQEWQQIGQVLQESFHDHKRVTLKLYDPVEDKEMSGFVTVINTYRKEIKLRYDDEWDWIKLDDILSVSI